jgi:hypothetical protein
MRFVFLFDVVYHENILYYTVPEIRLKLVYFLSNTLLSAVELVKSASSVTPMPFSFAKWKIDC